MTLVGSPCHLIPWGGVPPSSPLSPPTTAMSDGGGASWHSALSSPVGVESHELGVSSPSLILD